VLAIATFGSVRSANRAARVAERSLLIGLRPVLVPSRPSDPEEKVMFVDGHFVKVAGGMASVEEIDGTVYLAFTIRNVGAGIAVLHGWHLAPDRLRASTPHPEPEDFRRLQRDLYVAPGDSGFWQGALRESDDELRTQAAEVSARGDRMTVDLLYGDHEGEQHMISRFSLTRAEGARWFCGVTRHWSLDGPDPRTELA
jgi:hypothetical protein